MQPSRDVNRLLEIMASLRSPGTGCGWDLEQTFETIAPFTIEEAYEVADAVARGDMAELREELGDLLLQVVFQARIAEESGAFDFGGVVEAITEKMIRRHPHVFGEAQDLSPEEVKALWAQIKADERSAKDARERARSKEDAGKIVAQNGLLDNIALALPGLTRAVKLQAKASSVGFDWNDARMVIAKIREETDEIEAAIEAGVPDAVGEEIGDLLFTVANLARHAHADPESAIRRANAKFERRFRFIEERLAAKGVALGAASLDEMDALWTEAKIQEKQAGS
ncbi:nucleoside triphosphate pyrophosphohydrolase [Methylocapsa polymorpha]|uniref:Nucleoside triphosphate pyrophosphohydrolase n=1 Tax=Methylocapsa polymorpha TaxID=3080828 RepID=A0ABZ0HQ61_9HYPH|nr:nucleoside triphosphate pyrophosphohydrolase [Methylocapsa sp. RX1]